MHAADCHSRRGIRRGRASAPLRRLRALFRHQVTRRSSPLFSLFFPEIYSERRLVLRRNPGVAESGASKITAGCLAVFRCFPLFFADLRYSSRCPVFTVSRTAAGHGAVPVLLFLQKIYRHYPFSCGQPAPLSISSYRYLRPLRKAAIRRPPCGTRLLQKYAIVN